MTGCPESKALNGQNTLELSEESLNPDECAIGQENCERELSWDWWRKRSQVRAKGWTAEGRASNSVQRKQWSRVLREDKTWWAMGGAENIQWTRSYLPVSCGAEDFL